MKSQWHRARWGVVSALLTGLLVTCLQSFWVGSWGINGFAPADFTVHLLINSGTALLLFWLLALSFKLVRKFCRWFFSWRIFKQSLLIGAALLVVILVFYGEEDFRGWYDWTTFKHDREAKGEKFDFASFVPSPVPDGQNFALTPIVASSYRWCLDKDGEPLKPPDTNVVNRMECSIFHRLECSNQPASAVWQSGHTTDLKAWQNYYRSPILTFYEQTNFTNEFSISPEAQSPAEDVLLALSKYDATIGELRRASHMPYSRYPLGYQIAPPMGICQPHLSSLARCGQVLSLRAIAELELGRTEEALDDVKLGLRLADAIRTEPFMISQLVRARILRDMLQPVVDGLVKHEWADADLLELEWKLSQPNLLADLQMALRGRRASDLATIDYYQYPRDYYVYAGYSCFVNQHTFQWDRWMLLGALEFHLLPDGWFDRQRLKIAQTDFEQALRIADPARHLAFPQYDINLDEVEDATHPWYIFRANGLRFSHEHDCQLFIYTKEAVDLARVACCLERYRLATGKYPETLDALSPRFLKTIPHDIMGGQPLQYQRTDTGRYLLYSIGWNEKDDGGAFPERGFDTFDPDIRTGDWVWPAPE